MGDATREERETTTRLSAAQRERLAEWRRERESRRPSETATAAAGAPTGRSPRREVPATPLVLATGALVRIGLIGVIAGLIVFGLGLAVLLAFSENSSSLARELDADRFGRGILPFGFFIACAGGLLLGFATTLDALARWRWYRRIAAEHGPRSTELRGTVEARGRLAGAPGAPAIVSLGAIALLSAFAALFFGMETGEVLDGSMDAEDLLYPIGLTISAGVLAAAVGGILLLVRADRRFATRLLELPRFAVAGKGTARRPLDEQRAGRGIADRVERVGVLAIVAGSLVLFAGVFVRQPGRFAEPREYGPAGEALVGALLGVGAGAVVLGVLVVLASGFLRIARALSVAARVARDPAAVSERDLAVSRRATATFTTSLTGVAVAWAMVGVLTAGVFLTRDVILPMDGVEEPASFYATIPADGAPLALVWLGVFAVTIAGTIALDAAGARLRNRLGVEPE